MEQQRLLLFVALAFILFLLWDAWQQDYGPKPAQPTATAQAPGAAGGDVPTAEAMPDDVPVAASGTGETTVGAAPSDVPHGVPVAGGFLPRGQRIEVITDLVRAEIDTHGGDLRKVALLTYPEAHDQPDRPFHLMNDVAPQLFVAQSGFTAKRTQSDEFVQAAPNHNTVFSAANTRYTLDPGADTVAAEVFWISPEGVKFTKRYTFTRGSYLIKVEHLIDNPTDRPWRGNLYKRLLRNYVEDSGSAFIYTYTGGVYYSPENKYQKYDYDDMADQALSQDITGGWAAMIQHYFLGAWVPPAEQAWHYFTSTQVPDRYVIGLYSGEHRVAAGSTQTLASQLFVGPKLQSELEAIAPGLELTVDYGWLTVLAEPLFWLLDWIHGVVANWGWSIIILTILIKLVFYKLSEASYRSMAHMKKVAPRMQALKERYGDDKQRMQQALMDLYKKEKINPLGGCLPILVQIPVFIALYWVLLESVELRQAPWILWIEDLSIRDPYFILPVVMGVTMFIQHKLNPTPVDPMQAKIMMMLPIVFTFFFMFFPAGLVLYWVVNNTLSIAQQWYITRIVLSESS